MDISMAFLPCPDSGVRLIRVNHAAKKVGCTEQTIRRWVREGKLRARRIGLRVWGIYSVDLESLCNLRRRSC